MNRLAAINNPSITWAYDRFGNRWQQNSTVGGSAPQYTFDTNNHITGSGIVYDALGNVLNDGVGNAYSYDAENRAASTANASGATTYVYDGFNHRVAKQSGGASTVEYLYDLNDRAVTMFNGSGVWSHSELYAGGRHLATYSGDTTNFLSTDWLGTKRATTDPFGNVSETCYTWPFGDNRGCSGTDWSYFAFTNDEHDFESNTEHTQFRQLSTTEGRWLSPDPYLGSMDLANPQSLNRYAYVNGQPTVATDPTGAFWEFAEPCGLSAEFRLPCGNGAWFGWVIRFIGPIVSREIGGGGGGRRHGGGGAATDAGINPSEQPPPLSGESLGIPNTVHIRVPSILQTLGLAPIDPACDFIACGSDIGNGFQDARALSVVPFCVAQPELCILGAGLLGLGYLVTHPMPPITFADHGIGNVSDTGIMEEAQTLVQAGKAFGICGALEILEAAAKQAGDTAKLQKIKRTQKGEGCRGSRLKR